MKITAVNESSQQSGNDLLTTKVTQGFVSSAELIAVLESLAGLPLTDAAVMLTGNSGELGFADGVDGYNFRVEERTVAKAASEASPVTILNEEG